ncbi:hypothetical protein HY768_08045 [candidate division TA06 bacterium]|uniref:Discoidin domain-containing protein n=1 Tax=candidate division TA06 bacterium TaxID=2250710 RepID=A0A933IAD0_UNCT6|nr:hypothetical protein [candidate division TA06 bacterium]
MVKRKNKTFWPAISLGLLVFLALAAGCSKSPTEAPTSTVISGYDSLGVAQGDSPDTYYFKSGTASYGSIQLWWFLATTPSTIQLRSNYGIKMGTGNVAPDSGYVHELTLDNSPAGQSFFIITDNIPHYGKITITSRRDDAASGYTFIGFQWIVQTVAGKRELY